MVLFSRIKDFVLKYTNIINLMKDEELRQEFLYQDEMLVRFHCVEIIFVDQFSLLCNGIFVYIVVIFES